MTLRLLPALALLLFGWMAVSPASAQTGAVSDEDPTAAADVTRDRIHPVWENFAPRFRTQVCPFPIAGGYDPEEIRCGYVLVPEDRTWAGSRLIRLSVLVIKSTSSAPPVDPIMRLTGGPGGPSLSGGRVNAYRVPATAKMREAADLVFFDQRGVGHSESEFCRALPLSYQYGVRDDDADDLVRADLATCLEDARAEGVAVEGYTNWQNALDVRDIRIALGYDRWNLFGVSYGTELGQAVMTVDPGGTKAVILDSPVPANMPVSDVDLLLANGFRSSLNAINEMCAADADCARAIPDFGAKVEELMADYDAEPLVLTGLGPDQTTTGEIVIDGSTIGDAVFQALYRRDVYPSLPAMLRVLENRDGVALTAYVETLSYPIDHRYGDGMQMVINCRSGWREDAAAPPPPGPDGSALATYGSAGNYDRLCEGLLDTSPDPTTKLVESDIPTLVVTGLADPITPPYYADIILPGLANGQRVDFPFTGHGGLLSHFDTCGQDILIEFFTDPIAPVDASCAEAVSAPTFIVNLRETKAPFRFARSVQAGQYPLAAIAAVLGLVMILIAFLVTPLARRFDRVGSGNYGRARTLTWIGGALTIAGAALSVQTILTNALNNPAILPLGAPSHIGVGGWIAAVGLVFCLLGVWRALSRQDASRRVFGTRAAIVIAALLSFGVVVFVFQIGAGPF